jgi:hypothetical protein
MDRLVPWWEGAPAEELDGYLEDHPVDVAAQPSLWTHEAPVPTETLLHQPRPIIVSFGRIVELPFADCLEGFRRWWQADGCDGRLMVGHSSVDGPLVARPEGERASAARLASHRWWPSMPMKLSFYPVRTYATWLELRPLRLPYPSPRYFRAGNAMVDSIRQALVNRLA